MLCDLNLLAGGEQTFASDGTDDDDDDDATVADDITERIGIITLATAGSAYAFPQARLR